MYPAASEGVSPVGSNLQELKEEPEEDKNKSTPEWYRILMALPGWKRYGPTIRDACHYLGEKKIDADHAESTALALKAKWGGPGWKYKDPWSTFQNWVKRPPFNLNGNRPPQDLSSPSRVDEFKAQNIADRAEDERIRAAQERRRRATPS